MKHTTLLVSVSLLNLFLSSAIEAGHDSRRLLQQQPSKQQQTNRPSTTSAGSMKQTKKATPEADQVLVRGGTITFEGVVSRRFTDLAGIRHGSTRDQIRPSSITYDTYERVPGELIFRPCDRASIEKAVPLRNVATVKFDLDPEDNKRYQYFLIEIVSTKGVKEIFCSNTFYSIWTFTGPAV